MKDALFSNEQPLSTHDGFTKIYREGNMPWEIHSPQPAFVEIAEKVKGPVLDAGCGTGNNALFFASRGLQVTGIDFVEEAIQQAREKASEGGLNVEFLVKDAMTLKKWDRRFASVIDSGLFHIYHGPERLRYVEGLEHVLEPGGRLFLFAFSDIVSASVPGGGNSRRDLYDVFCDGWEIESLDLVGGEVNPAFADAFADTKMWFAVIRRVA